MKKIGINGFGRIGRLVFRELMELGGVKVVGINDLANTKTISHLLKYDSVHGRSKHDVSYDKDCIVVNRDRIKVSKEPDPENIPWRDLEVDIVVESTGLFTSQEDANKHLKAGAKKVVISAPAKGDIPTIVLGVNDNSLTKDMSIVSNASCTTNCLAPMAKVLDDNFGIEKGYITTIHAYTSDQRIHDAPHRDLRRARAASLSIIPTSTGAAKAVGLVLPHLKGKLDGCAMRVPISDGSLTDLTVILNQEVDKEAVNEAMKKASESYLKKILYYEEDPIVSADIVGNKHSCIFDSLLTNTNGKLVKVIGWYDNEMGYAVRVTDLIRKLLI